MEVEQSLNAILALLTIPTPEPKEQYRELLDASKEQGTTAG
jgi:hypothetical protein